VPGWLAQVDHFLAGQQFRQGRRAHLGPVACAWVNHDQDMRDARELGVALDARFAPVGDVQEQVDTSANLN
jgi:hypothetical protein